MNPSATHQYHDYLIPPKNSLIAGRYLVVNPISEATFSQTIHVRDLEVEMNESENLTSSYANTQSTPFKSALKPIKSLFTLYENYS
jgi:hypothetical protein